METQILNQRGSSLAVLFGTEVSQFTVHCTVYNFHVKQNAAKFDMKLFS